MMPDSRHNREILDVPDRQTENIRAEASDCRHFAARQRVPADLLIDSGANCAMLCLTQRRIAQTMLRSEKRILTTHTGSLPRPPELTRLYVRRARGEAVDPAAVASAGKTALAWVV